MAEQSLTSFLDSLAVVQQAQPRLAGFRRAKGISQSDIARSLGVSQAYVSQVENGTHTASVDTLSHFYSILAGGTNAEEEIHID